MLLRTKNLKNQNKILIGYDTRKDSKKYAELTYKVLESNNIEAFILHVLRLLQFVVFI